MQGHKGLMHRIKAVDPVAMHVCSSFAYHIGIDLRCSLLTEKASKGISHGFSKRFQTLAFEFLTRLESFVPF